MKNRILNEIVIIAAMHLKNTYGYCGVADSDDFTMLNSGKDTNITIKIEEKEK